MLKSSSRAAEGAAACVVSTDDQEAPLHYVGAHVYRVIPGAELSLAADPLHECALVLTAGSLDVQIDGGPVISLRGRTSVFDPAAPYVIYVGPGKGLWMQAQERCEVVWATARLEPGVVGMPCRIFGPDDMPVETRGEGVTERTVRHLLEEPGQAERLRLVEVITPGGHWSSFPPHKHDTEKPGVESLLEELYYYHIEPSHLWAFQRVYDSSGWGEALAVGDGDLVAVPRGYHPVSVPPGCTAYYLNIMAGTTREWNFTVDPAFSHVPGFSTPKGR